MDGDGRGWSLPLKKLPKSSPSVRQCVRCNGFSPRQVNSIRKEAVVRARQTEMFAQRRPFVVAPKQSAAL